MINLAVALFSIVALIVEAWKKARIQKSNKVSPVAIQIKRESLEKQLENERRQMEQAELDRRRSVAQRVEVNQNESRLAIIDEVEDEEFERRLERREQINKKREEDRRLDMEKQKEKLLEYSKELEQIMVAKDNFNKGKQVGENDKVLLDEDKFKIKKINKKDSDFQNDQGLFEDYKAEKKESLDLLQNVSSKHKNRNNTRKKIANQREEPIFKELAKNNKEKKEKNPVIVENRLIKNNPNFDSDVVIEDYDGNRLNVKQMKPFKGIVVEGQNRMRKHNKMIDVFRQKK